jgi:microcystin-dependent protein
MPVTSRMALRYPDLANMADVPLYIEDLAVDVNDNAAGWYPPGNFSIRPAAGKVGYFYFATDQNVLYVDDGTTWHALNFIASGTITSAMIADGTIVDTDLAADTLTGRVIAANAIGPSELADAAVDTLAIQAGAVTLSRIDAAVPLIPVGGVIEWPWAAASIPAWSALPYGQLLLASDFPAMQTLADASGRPYGGSVGVNFNMPDMRGRVAAGKDDMGGAAANRITAAISGIAGTVLGGVFGAEGITLISAQIPAHTHTFTTGIESADHTHVARGDSGYSDVGESGYVVGAGYMLALTPSGPSPAFENVFMHNGGSTGVSTTHTHSGTTNNNAGGGGVHQNTQPSIIVNKLMRVL